ncbi:MAG: terminase [Desulfurellales bacterium]|nr:MAG: terminase [Desulfurellales bacterium]
MAEATIIRPQYKQELFLATPADIAIFGGGAGGGKSWALLLEPLRHVHNGRFGAVIFRRTYPQIASEGGLWDQSMKLYPYVGGRPRQSDVAWAFPSGAKFKFAHLQHEANVLDWQGSELPFIGWDELTHFSEAMFFYLLSRNRSMCGVRPYVRATTNPDADSWVARFIAWWLNEDGYAIPERSGVLRWFVRIGGEFQWADTPEQLKEQFGPDVIPKSVTFIPALVQDNQELLKADPGYLANLHALSLVDRARLLDGNWKVRPEAGKVFNRAWFGIVDAVPAGGRSVRFWDFAATEKKLKDDDPDWTVGGKLTEVDGHFYIEDIVRERVDPARADKMMLNTAAQDGRKVEIGWEIEPGSAGKKVNKQLVTMLRGYIARGQYPVGDKVQRAKPAAAQAEAGNIRLVRGAWNEAFLAEAHGFPDLPHDDQVDFLSGAFNRLSGAAKLDSASIAGETSPSKWLVGKQDSEN